MSTATATTTTSTLLRRTLLHRPPLLPLRRPETHLRALRTHHAYPPQLQRHLFPRPFRWLNRRPLSAPKNRLYSAKLPPPPPPPSPPPASLSTRLRNLSREYGYSALFVYLALSALDFPFCFAAVRYIGADTLGRWEHTATSYLGQYVPEPVKEGWRVVKGAVVWGVEGLEEVMGVGGGGAVSEVEGGALDGVAEGKGAKGGVSLWTQLALAYAIHKSFIFVRVPAAVAVTPKFVKTLRGWGWDIGRKRKK